MFNLSIAKLFDQISKSHFPSIHFHNSNSLYKTIKCFQLLVSITSYVNPYSFHVYSTILQYQQIDYHNDNSY